MKVNHSKWWKLVSNQEAFLILYLSVAFTVLLGANYIIFFFLLVWNTFSFMLVNSLPAMEFWFRKKVLLWKTKISKT